MKRRLHDTKVWVKVQWEKLLLWLMPIRVFQRLHDMEMSHKAMLQSTIICPGCDGLFHIHGDSMVHVTFTGEQGKKLGALVCKRCEHPFRSKVGARKLKAVPPAKARRRS